MASLNFSNKYMAISKANSQMVIIVGVASFITVFCLIASNAVFNQYKFQGKVINAVTQSKNQLNSNIAAYKSLISKYQAFDNQNPNILGGPVTDNTNDNAQIILRALPGEYDYPALISSVEKMLKGSGMDVTGVTGNDAPPGAATTTGSSTPTPAPPTSGSSTPTAVSMPFGFTVDKATYASIQSLAQTMQQSIRPISVDSLEVIVVNSSLSMTVAAHSYYQPQATLNFSNTTVK